MRPGAETRAVAAAPTGDERFTQAPLGVFFFVFGGGGRGGTEDGGGGGGNDGGGGGSGGDGGTPAHVADWVPVTPKFAPLGGATLLAA